MKDHHSVSFKVYEDKNCLSCACISSKVDCQGGNYRFLSHFQTSLCIEVLSDCAIICTYIENQGHSFGKPT